jgi:hypothetical protein
MYRFIMLVGLFASGAALTGCATHGLQRDQDQIRHALLDLYTNQIMDNLVRQRNGLPIIQLDYINANATLTITDKMSMIDNLVTANPGVLSVVKASAATVAYTTTNTVTPSVSSDRSNQVQVTAVPVITSDAVYDAYRDFLAIPGSLQESCAPPPPGVAHLCKKCGHTHYWVPVEYQKAFLALALATTAQRGDPAAGPDLFYAVKLMKFMGQEPPPVPEEKMKFLRVKLNKKIPADTGYIEIGAAASAPAAKAPATALTPPAKTPTPAPAPGAAQPADGAAASDPSKISRFFIADSQPSGTKRLRQTDEIIIYFDPAKAKGNIKTADDLFTMPPTAANIYLDRNRPSTSAVNEAQNRIEFQLQQIQLNQYRLGQ